MNETTMPQFKIDKAKRKYRIDAEDARAALALLDRPEVEATIRAFDGKQINKRLFDALAVAMGGRPGDRDGFGHSYDVLNPSRDYHGKIDGAVLLRVPHSWQFHGFRVVANGAPVASARVDAAGTVAKVRERVTQLRAFAARDFDAEIDRLVVALNAVGKTLAALEEKFDAGLWYALDMSKARNFCR